VAVVGKQQQSLPRSTIAQRATMDDQAAARDDCVVPIAKLQPTYVLIWRWVEQWLEKPIPAGMKSLMILHLVITATTVNKAMRSMVLDNAFVLDILTLLKATAQDPKHRTVEFHNRALCKSVQCHHIVTYVQRSRIPRTRAVVAATSWKPMAFMSCARTGKLTAVSEPMVRLVHSQWKRVTSRLRQFRQSHRCSSTILANILVEDGHTDHKLLQIHGTINKRSASIPVILKRSSSMQRAPRPKSLPRLWEDPE
jgi:hypothetical protein